MVIHMSTTQTTNPVIAFTNHGGKVHTHARCGVTSRSLLWNAPQVRTLAWCAEDQCKRCAGRGFMEATDENIAKAAMAAGRQSGRLAEQVPALTASLTAQRDGLLAEQAEVDVVEMAAALLLGVER